MATPEQELKVSQEELDRARSRTLFPEINPYKVYRLKVGTPLSTGETHELSIKEYGTPDGIPIVVNHGGPGAGISGFYAQLLDPTKYRIILYDQRGAGESTPKGCMEQNTSRDLVEDLEAIRNLLGIEKWAVHGGSWGSTLSLLYAEKYPEQVLGLILRGVFLARQQDTDAFTTDEKPATAFVYSKEWQQFKQDTDKMLQDSHADASLSSNDIVAAYHYFLNQPNKALRVKAAGRFALWEKQVSNLAVNQKDLQWALDPEGVNMGRTEVHYMYHKWFIGPNEILDNVARLANIPVYIAQGRYDLVCPMYQAEELVAGLRRVGNPHVTMYDSIAGHSTKEQQTMGCLVHCGAQLAARLRPELTAAAAAGVEAAGEGARPASPSGLVRRGASPLGVLAPVPPPPLTLPSAAAGGESALPGLAPRK